jgi:aspartyl-tRNA synthetase
LLFIDLRDHYGLTQVVVDTSSPVFPVLEKVRLESVIKVDGKVVKRDADTVNPKLATGEIEVDATAVEVLSSADVLPIQVGEEYDNPEEMRLKYRYIDLRREKLHNNIVLRSKLISYLRQKMGELGFLEYQTPILTASSPEGARDFLVPSRLHPGEFYALPQAPQQFKQLLMVAGFDRYFQIAPCFRDEDSRADRSPGEFYQMDFEMSFATQEEIFKVLEEVLFGAFDKFAVGKKVDGKPFKRITFKDSMLKYGTDKPDLRNPLVISDVTEAFKGSSFGIFANAIEKGAVVRAVPAPKAADKPRSWFDKLNEWARANGQGGLGYIVFGVDGEAKGPIAKNLDAERIAAIKKTCELKDGDAVFFVCGQENTAAKFAGLVRTNIGEQLGLIDENTFKFCFIVDFPMYEKNEETGLIEFSHNPFSMPQGGLKALEEQNPLDIIAYQYDVVCNGIELSSGAIRNHDPEIMYKAFAIAGYDKGFVESKFGGMLTAFKFGAPPHGGAAPGVDRMVMLLCDEPNIREVILFPLNQQAQDLLMQAPAPVTLKQLRELHIEVKLPPDLKKKQEEG